MAQSTDDAAEKSASKENSVSDNGHGDGTAAKAAGADTNFVKKESSTETNAPAKAEAGDAKDAKPEKKPVITWERTIDVVKLVATVWVALIGSYVTMEYNNRQHELNRIEAIAQMLPHISGAGSTAGGPADGSGAKEEKGNGDEMAKDGAIWAIFRTANNKTMLRDLAALFPGEIYHVVSSIANSGELDHDSDAVCALGVASEKLANKYSGDPKKAELAGRLFAQALKLRQRQADDNSSLRVIDISSSAQTESASSSDDSLERLIKSINDLADEHLLEKAPLKTPSGTKKKTGDTQWEAIELYQRARSVGVGNRDPQVQEQLTRADLSLASLYINLKQPDDAFKYLKEAIAYMNEVTGKKQEVKALDKDGDGFVALPELAAAIEQAQGRYKQMMIDFPDKGAEINE